MVNWKGVVMYDSKLSHYIKTYNVISKDLCIQSVEELSKLNNFEQHSFYDPKSNEHETHDKDLSISYSYISTYNALLQLTWDSIKQYILEDFNFPWYQGWQGHTELRFNKYEPGTLMKIHCDHIHGMFDGLRKGIPVLTCLGLLNDDFEGGELELCGKNINFKSGDILIFPSNFLYPHKVLEVSKGTRYSFVSWVW